MEKKKRQGLDLCDNAYSLMDFREAQCIQALNANADLRVRKIWVTSVNVTIKMRIRKAVLLHLRQGLEHRIREIWVKSVLLLEERTVR